MFGLKRLQLYENGGQIRARIWLGSTCLYNMAAEEHLSSLPDFTTE
jgi:hypothetical protein